MSSENVNELKRTKKSRNFNRDYKDDMDDVKNNIKMWNEEIIFCYNLQDQENKRVNKRLS
jgi:hypothetical protein